jgi:hypothetical protein
MVDLDAAFGEAELAPDALAEAIAAEINREVSYRPSPPTARPGRRRCSRSWL